eukprot:1011871-Rhodomonas_salina.1
MSFRRPKCRLSDCASKSGLLARKISHQSLDQQALNFSLRSPLSGKAKGLQRGTRGGEEHRTSNTAHDFKHLPVNLFDFIKRRALP